MRRLAVFALGAVLSVAGCGADTVEREDSEGVYSLACAMRTEELNEAFVSSDSFRINIGSRIVVPETQLVTEPFDRSNESCEAPCRIESGGIVEVFGLRYGTNGVVYEVRYSAPVQTSGEETLCREGIRFEISPEGFSDLNRRYIEDRMRVEN